jgi:hypothetical protein
MSKLRKQKSLLSLRPVFQIREPRNDTRPVEESTGQLLSDGPHELHDLTTDPGEAMNLYGQPRRAALQRELTTQLREFFDHHADPQYDLPRRWIEDPAAVGSETRADREITGLMPSVVPATMIGACRPVRIPHAPEETGSESPDAEA